MKKKPPPRKRLVFRPDEFHKEDVAALERFADREGITTQRAFEKMVAMGARIYSAALDGLEAHSPTPPKRIARRN